MVKLRWLLVTFVLIVAMTSYLGTYALASEPVSAVKKDTVYSNESFSIKIPKGWEGNDSLWDGPVSSFHEMDIYNKEVAISDPIHLDFLSVLRYI